MILLYTCLLVIIRSDIILVVPNNNNMDVYLGITNMRKKSIYVLSQLVDKDFKNNRVNTYKERSDRGRKTEKYSFNVLNDSERKTLWNLLQTYNFKDEQVNLKNMFITSKVILKTTLKVDIKKGYYIEKTVRVPLTIDFNFITSDKFVFDTTTMFYEVNWSNSSYLHRVIKTCDSVFRPRDKIVSVNIVNKDDNSVIIVKNDELNNTDMILDKNTKASEKSEDIRISREKLNKTSIIFEPIQEELELCGEMNEQSIKSRDNDEEKFFFEEHKTVLNEMSQVSLDKEGLIFQHAILDDQNEKNVISECTTLAINENKIDADKGSDPKQIKNNVNIMSLKNNEEIKSVSNKENREIRVNYEIYNEVIEGLKVYSSMFLLGIFLGLVSLFVHLLLSNKWELY
ncbi:putative SP-containing membrane protein [Vairimorpha necatrix]|uniref:SP-containing membrane protein n=1 Tax=Vairimorpha necatrix TaxID=6039 RepID=A0AAX4JE69_9MICR